MICALALLFGAYSSSFSQDAAKLKSGDIIFITSLGGQGKAIQLATHSRYTHVGIIMVEKGIPYVYHAVEPVMKSTVKEFMAFSSDGKYVVKRLKDRSILADSTVKKMDKMAASLVDKHYDLYFNWSDDDWYCSEYVWKIYKRNCNLALGSPKQMKEYDLSAPEVQYIMKRRYGDKIPYNELMVSPEEILKSPLLEEVKL